MSDIERGMLLMRWLEVMNAMYRLIREVDVNAHIWPTNNPPVNSPLGIAYDIAKILGKDLRSR